MATYSSEDLLYRAVQQLFETMRAQTPNPIDQLAAQKMLVRLRFSDPSAQVMVNGRRDPVRIQYGRPTQPVTTHPDLDAEMAADTFHLILINNLSLKTALANKKVRVGGALWKTNSLAHILEYGRMLYPIIARQHGLIE